MVNPYNEHLLHAWRANMDVQVVDSVYGAAYVTHYICKDESQGDCRVLNMMQQLNSGLGRLATLCLVIAS